jgi:site-specific recombinase XerD
MPLSSAHVAPFSFPDPVEAEFAKDIWDVRRIPGTRYSPCRSIFFLNFTDIALAFRPVVKRHIQLMLMKYSVDHCRNKTRHLQIFLDFFVLRRPGVAHFQQVDRADIEAYLIYLRTERGKHWSEQEMIYALSTLKQFLEYLQHRSAFEAPQQPVGKLIWPDDVGRKSNYYSGETVKYIPEGILHQIDQQIHQFPAEHLPIFILLRASGWRIADVLNLRCDTCLEHSASGWWLCGDIRKTNMLNHKVPISDEIAALVTTQREYVEKHVQASMNPQRYLFPAQTEERKGLAQSADDFRYVLTSFSKKAGLTDEAGNAFRHTKAVELINNGMSLFYVQKWMAHLSPQMTMVYAKLLDPTMRRAWEEAFARGAVRIDAAGVPRSVDPKHLAHEHEIEWEHIRHNLDAVRLPNGYCFKPKKAHCPTQETPCYTCHHFCTTPDFLPQFEREEREMRELIALGEKAGSEIWVERNTQKLGRLLPVIQVLRKGDLHHPAGKAIREYTPEERIRRT